ncbi:MAG: hypothetical protein JNM27_09265 [Leptospirales bacterium]|nr:hypothetical protein [Leptospirales bacterium]
MSIAGFAINAKRRAMRLAPLLMMTALAVSVLRCNEVRLGGECIKGDCVNGMGQIRLSDGSVHEGDFRDGVPNGFGQRTTQDGKVYVGDWRGDDIPSYAAVFLKKGWDFTGGIENLLFQGEGILHWKCGASVKGQWERGRLHGTAVWHLKIPGEPKRLSVTMLHGVPESGNGVGYNDTGEFIIGTFLGGRWSGRRYSSDCVPLE